MGKQYDIDVETLSKQLIKAILEERHFSEDVLVKKVVPFIKAFVKKQDAPSNYNAIPNPNQHAQRLRTIEQKDLELKYWLDVARNVIGHENMKPYYVGQQQLLLDNGFIKEIKL